jgi:hypothetical protein
MQSQKNPDRPRNRLQPPMSARSSAALGSNPQGDPSWSPLTLRGHATSKVSHTGDDCNDNLRYATDHAQWFSHAGDVVTAETARGAPAWCGRRPP